MHAIDFIIVALVQPIAPIPGVGTMWYSEDTASTAAPDNKLELKPLSRPCPGISVDSTVSHAWGGGIGSANVQRFNFRLISLLSMVQSGGVVTLKFEQGSRIVIDQVLDYSPRHVLSSSPLTNGLQI